MKRTIEEVLDALTPVGVMKIVALAMAAMVLVIMIGGPAAPPAVEVARQDDSLRNALLARSLQHNEPATEQEEEAIRRAKEAEDDVKALLEAFENLLLAHFTGNQNRCPQFRMIDKAVNEELQAGGFEPDVKECWAMDKCRMRYVEKYTADPSAFCKMAWDRLGPNGTSKRQMLEAK